jgi:hypothetical protein
VGAVVGVEAGVGQADTIDGTAVKEVLVDDLLGVVGVGEAVPDGFGIDDQNGAVLALIEAAGLIDADTVLEAGSFDGILEGTTEFFAVFVAATGAGSGFVALVQADKEVTFEDWHRDNWMPEGTPGCGTAPR